MERVEVALHDGELGPGEGGDLGGGVAALVEGGDEVGLALLDSRGLGQEAVGRAM